MKVNQEQARYGNWVSTALIGKVSALTLVLGGSTAASFIIAPAWGVGGIVLRVLLSVLTALALASLLYFVIARRQFSYEGGGVQGKVLELLLAKIKWNGQGKALDIGCGSGALTIALAKRFRNARVTGVDYWGGSWSYSQKQCEENAALEGVGNRVGFSQASTARLPIADESFDLAVSNLTFHEVKGDKLDVLREALRVVKKGGRFAFQDLFLLKAYYGKQEELIAAVQAMGIRQVYFADTSKAAFIPRILKLPFMVGTIGVLYGIK